MNAAKLALLAGGAYLLWRAYANSALPVPGSPAPAGSPPTPGPAAPPPSGGAPSGGGGGAFGTVQLTDNSGAGASAFKVGDTWTLTVTGPPNSPVMITATQNGGNIGTSQLGTTDGNGLFVLTGSWAAMHAGAWVETVTVGGQPALPVLKFNVGLSGFGQPGPRFTVADLRSAVQRGGGRAVAAAARSRAGVVLPVPRVMVRGSHGRLLPLGSNARVH